MGSSDGEDMRTHGEPWEEGDCVVWVLEDFVEKLVLVVA